MELLRLWPADGSECAMKILQQNINICCYFIVFWNQNFYRLFSSSSFCLLSLYLTEVEQISLDANISHAYGICYPMFLCTNFKKVLVYIYYTICKTWRMVCMHIKFFQSKGLETLCTIKKYNLSCEEWQRQHKLIRKKKFCTSSRGITNRRQILNFLF